MPHRRDAFRVVDSGFSPADISGLEIWYKADTGVIGVTNTPPVNGEAVATWSDQSGNGNDGTVDGITFTNNLNGAKALLANGTTLLFIEADNAVTDSAVTSFYVLETSDTAYILSSETGQSATYIGHANNGQAPNSYSTAGTVVNYTNNVSIGTSRDNVHDAVSVGATRVVTITSDFSDWGDGLNVLGFSPFGGFQYSGYIREYLLYNTALSSDDRQSVTDYLADKWPD